MGAGAVGAGAVISGCAGGAVRKAPIPSRPPQYGGRLRVGIVGGSSKDTLDAHAAVTHPDQARNFQLYDTLLKFNSDYQIDGSWSRRPVRGCRSPCGWTGRRSTTSGCGRRSGSSWTGSR